MDTNVKRNVTRFRSIAHCCSTDGPCEKNRASAPTDGQQIFVAHPFTPVINEWVAELQQKLDGYVSVVLPEQKLGTGVLFCKICQQIRSATCIVSEMTELNRNVIFEHGFALATGARAVIVRNRTRLTPSQLDVLSDIERKDYASVDEVVEHLLELATEGSLNRVIGADGEPKLLGEWDLSPYETDYSKICFLRTQAENTDNLKRISKTLRSSQFKTIDSVDPEEYATHRLFEYCRRIKEAFGVVGHFVADNTEHHERDNALTALLLGIAVGLGKRIFVLQELPIAKQMIDLGGVLKSYSTRADLESALSNRVTEWWKQASAIGEQVNHATVIAATQRGALEFGRAAAEYDELLLRAYYDTAYTEWASEGKKFLIVGTKGSGKSAIYKYVENLAPEGRRVHRLFYEFTDVEVQQLFELAESWRASVSPDLVLRTFWRFNLVLDIVDKAFPADDNTLKFDDDLRRLVDWRTSLGVPDESDFFVRFLTYLKASPEEPPKSSELVRARFTEVEGHLRAALSGHSVYVYADRLDEGWEHESDLARRLLKAFVHECFLLKHSMPDSVKPVLFLRVDIIEELKQGLQEADKWDVGYLRWTRSQLIGMLERRIGANQKEVTSEINWNALLPAALKGQRTVDYLLDRTYLRPRDAIQLLQTVIEQAQADGPLPAKTDSILRSISMFSRDRILNLSLELAGTHPTLQQVVEDILDLFPGADGVRLSALTARCLHLANVSKLDWLGLNPVGKLYEAGVVVFKDEEDKVMWSEDIGFDRALRLSKQMPFSEPLRRPWYLRWLGEKLDYSFEPLAFLHPALHGLLAVLSEQVVFRGRASE